MNINEGMTYQYLWVVAKAMFKEKFIITNACIKKEERFQNDNLIFYHKTMKKEVQTTTIRKNIIKCKILK
jgi:hypothetical protein